MSSPLLIGWKEYADFPDWGLDHVKVKADTGARTSALGVEDYRLVPDPTGPGEWIELRLRPYRVRPIHFVELRLPVVRHKRVRNSGGYSEVRPVVETVLHLGPLRKTIALTVTRRARMLVPVLLGRAALAKDCLVDPGRKFLVSQHR